VTTTNTINQDSNRTPDSFIAQAIALGASPEEIHNMLLDKTSMGPFSTRDTNIGAAPSETPGDSLLSLSRLNISTYGKYSGVNKLDLCVTTDGYLYNSTDIDRGLTDATDLNNQLHKNVIGVRKNKVEKGITDDVSILNVRIRFFNRDKHL
jgi:hypothetical protein